MKQRILVLAAIVLMTSCAQLRYYPGTVALSGLDFTEYTQKGFLFTPYEFKGEYDSMGLITLSISPQSFENNAKSAERVENGKDYQVVESATFIPVLVEVINPQEYLEIMYIKAVELGADAIADLRLTSSIEDRDFGKVYNYTLSGFAIRRK